MHSRVALLTNFVAPYRVPVFCDLQNRFRDFRIFISTPMESGRTWAPDWSGLSVCVQKSFSVQRNRAHPHRFTDAVTLHFPYDTVPALLKFSPDVIVSGELGARTVQAALYRACNPKVRLVIWATLSEVTEQARGRLRPILRKRLLRAADAVIVNGESGSRYVRGFGVEASRIFFAPQTTDIGPYLALPSSRPAELRHRLLISGRLIELKGILPFLKQLSAWAALHTNEIVELWFVGDGPLRRDIESFPVPENLRPRFWGDVDYSKLPAIYAQCGILAFPTLADEWGLVVVEAMAAGLPVLGSIYSQAVEELVSNGVEGWTFRSDCEDEVRAAVDCALSAGALRLEEMGIRARAKISAQTPSVMAGQIASAVDYAVHHPRP